MRDHRLTQARHHDRSMLASRDNEVGVVGRTTLVEAELGGSDSPVQRAGAGRSVFADAAACVQRRAELALVQARGALDGPDVHAVAARGVAGTGSPLPHLDLIQKSFGHHDIGGVRAHIGGDSAAAASAIGATAYATGDAVVFASAPDLHLAAHEAAHVVQQRAGVQLAEGVGRAGDAYECHADAVADLVVQGKSAESLLDQMACRGLTGGAAVQRDASGREPAPAQRRSASVSSLCGGELSHAIRAVAGGVGESRELELEVSIPVLDTGLVVGGALVVEVAHMTEGYKVSVSPRLRCGIGDPDGSADASLFAELTTEVRGRTPELAARLIEVALDRTLRASADRPLPAFVAAAALATGVIGTAGMAADATIRLCNYFKTGRPSSAFWLWLADALFSGGRQAQARAQMGADDYAETRDRVGLVGNYRPDRGHRASASAAAEHRWRVEGEAGDTERTYDTEVVEVVLGCAPFSGKAKFVRAARDPSVFAGECSITLAAEGSLAGFGTVLLVNHVMGPVFAAIMAAVGDDARPLASAGDPSAAIATALQAALSAGLGCPERGKLTIEIKVPFDGTPMTATFKIASDVNAIVGGNGARITGTQQIGRWHGPIITQLPRTERDGVGADHTTMNRRGAMQPADPEVVGRGGDHATMGGLRPRR